MIPKYSRMMVSTVDIPYIYMLDSMFSSPDLAIDLAWTGPFTESVEA